MTNLGLIECFSGVFKLISLKGVFILRVEQRVWTRATGWTLSRADINNMSPQLVLVFGSRTALGEREIFEEIRNLYPEAYIMGCSTAGEISGTRVLDDSLVCTAVEFKHTRLYGAQIKLSEIEDSFQAGEYLARSIPREKLSHLFVLSDGLAVNGSDLVKGLTCCLPGNVSVTGGLAGDGSDFNETLTFLNSPPHKDTVAVLGFYGERLKTGYGSVGGWDPFGPERLITRSEGNVLFEMDGRSALELYKLYLGEHAEGLPAAGLLFPLSIRLKDHEKGLVRTILSINEEKQSLTFAGDVPEGTYARLMKANFDRLIDGAMEAAKNTFQAVGANSPELAILISCVGRKLLLKQRTEEEVEGVRDILGFETALTGFYSYGEICPFTFGAGPELHNQTMTVTTFREE